MSRFQWSFSQFNQTAGQGVYLQDPWQDVGRHTHAVHCLPHNATLETGLKYVLHVRAWLSQDVYVTFISDPIVVDHSPPSLMKRKRVIESDVTCRTDVDYVTTEPDVTACWDGVFRDSDSPVARYQVWVGTAPYGKTYLFLMLSVHHYVLSLTVPNV